MRIREALMKLLLSQPFYGSLASVISMRESDAVAKIEMSLSPSPVLRYNREWYENLSDEQAVGALMHELLHLLLLHAIRRGERDPLLWAVCCDMAVNGHIPPDMLPESAVTTEKIERKIEHPLDLMRSAEHYYTALSNLLDDSIALFARDGTVSLPSETGGLMQADLFKEEDVSQVGESALKIQLQTLIDVASESGELPPELRRELTVSPKRSRIEWKNIFKRFLSGMGRMQIRATYKRDSRRFDGFPGHKRSIGLRVLAALDESGSISDEQLEIFFGELISISRDTNAEVWVTEFDSECGEPKPARAYRHQRERIKKGGTDFRPIFQMAEKLGIFSVIIFTDGNGRAPDHVDQRVLWILTHGGKQPAPYGYSVYFDA